MGDEEGKAMPWELIVAQAKANLPRLIELVEITMKENAVKAKALKAYYDSLCTEGFSEGQAMEIVKVHGWIAK